MNYHSTRTAIKSQTYVRGAGACFRVPRMYTDIQAPEHAVAVLTRTNRGGGPITSQEKNIVYKSNGYVRININESDGSP